MKNIQGKSWNIETMYSGDVGSNKDNWGNFQKAYVSPEYKTNQEYMLKLRKEKRAGGSDVIRAEMAKKREIEDKHFPIKGKGKLKGLRIRKVRH